MKIRFMQLAAAVAAARILEQVRLAAGVPPLRLRKTFFFLLVLNQNTSSDKADLQPQIKPGLLAQTHILTDQHS